MRSHCSSPNIRLLEYVLSRCPRPPKVQWPPSPIGSSRMGFANRILVQLIGRRNSAYHSVPFAFSIPSPDLLVTEQRCLVKFEAPSGRAVRFQRARAPTSLNFGQGRVGYHVDESGRPRWLMYDNNVNIFKIVSHCENVPGNGTISFVVTGKGFACKYLSNCR
jgi:hypothetical protein